MSIMKTQNRFDEACVSTSVCTGVCYLNSHVISHTQDQNIILKIRLL